MSRSTVRMMMAMATVAAAASCTVNGKPVFGLGARAPAAAPAGVTDASRATDAGDPPEAPTAHYTAPAWCQHASNDGLSDPAAALDPKESPRVILPGIVRGLCFPREDELAKLPALEALRRTWMKALALTEEDWATDIVGYAALDHSRRMVPPSIGWRDTKSWQEMRPIEQYVKLEAGNAYLADALGPKLSEVGRFALIKHCVQYGGITDEPHPGIWAACQPDLDALDRVKLAAELRTEPDRTLTDRMNIRLRLAEVHLRLAHHAAKVKALIARDPAYAKLFELARAAHRAWPAFAAEHADLLAAVTAMDEARLSGSRKAREGCGARLWPAFARAVARLGAARFDGLRPGSAGLLDAAIARALADPAVYLAANALAVCEDGADPLVERLLQAVQSTPGARGPRTSTLTAFYASALVPDREGDSLELPSFSVALDLDGRSNRTKLDRAASAASPIAKVTAQGDSVLLTFPATSAVVDRCTNRVRTNRIERIDAQGNVTYESRCTSWVTERVNTTLEPIAVPARYAAALAPGRYVSILAGLPEAVWARPGAPAPLAVFGVALAP